MATSRVIWNRVIRNIKQEKKTTILNNNQNYLISKNQYIICKSSDDLKKCFIFYTRLKTVFLLIFLPFLSKSTSQSLVRQDYLWPRQKMMLFAII